MRLITPRLPLAILVLGVIVTTIGFDHRSHATTDGGALSKLSSNLEELLESALRSNPEIMVKDAELREAIASLNQTRLAVTQQVVQLHFQRIELRQVLQAEEQRLEETSSMYRSGRISPDEVRTTTIAVAQAQGALARTEADLRYVIGAGGGDTSDESVLSQLILGRATERASDAGEQSVPRRPIPEHIQILLAKKVRASFEEIPLPEALEFLAQITGANIIVSPDIVAEDYTLQLQFREEMTMRQVLHAIADLLPVKFVVREYGLLVQDQYFESEDGSPMIP